MNDADILHRIRNSASLQRQVTALLSEINKEKSGALKRIKSGDIIHG